MPFKINISDKSGKTYKLELESEELNGKSLGEKIDGKEILPDLEGYELEITGLSDNAGFTAMQDVEGTELKKVLLPYGKAMHMKPKGDKKINRKPSGMRLRKTVRGKVISQAIHQINTKVTKQTEGAKKLEQVFSDQVKKEETAPAEGAEDASSSEDGKQTDKTPEKEATPSEKSTEGETPPKESSDTNNSPAKESG